MVRSGFCSFSDSGWGGEGLAWAAVSIRVPGWSPPFWAALGKTFPSPGLVSEERHPACWCSHLIQAGELTAVWTTASNFWSIQYKGSPAGPPSMAPFRGPGLHLFLWVALYQRYWREIYIYISAALSNCRQLWTFTFRGGYRGHPAWEPGWCSLHAPPPSRIQVAGDRIILSLSIFRIPPHTSQFFQLTDVIVPLLFLVIITFVMTFLHESHLRLVHFTDPFKEQIIVSLIFLITFMF